MRNKILFISARLLGIIFLFPISIFAQSISGGGDHTLVVCETGVAKSLGYNDSGQLGDGTLIDKNSPVNFGSLTNISQVCAGYSHSLALKNDGTVWASGQNAEGQLGIGNTSSQSSPVQTNISNIVSIAAGKQHSLALKNDGTVWAWGNNQSGQLGDNTKINKNSPIKVLGLSNIVRIACGYYHSLAIDNNGDVWSWGSNGWGQLGSEVETILPTKMLGLDNIIEASGGEFHSLFLKNDGKVWACGRNNEGQLGDSTFNYSTSPVKVTILDNIIDITAGLGHSMALQNNGIVWAWGLNGLRQLGDGTNQNRNYPDSVNNLNGVYDIAAGAAFSLALKSDGSVIGWGNNLSGQLNTASFCKVGTPLKLNSFRKNPICATSDGSISAIAKGGVLPYSYQWSSGQTNTTINNIASGSYTVTVTDGSSKSASQIINLANRPFKTTLSDTIFEGDSVKIGTNSYFSNGTFVDTLASFQGCDSIVTLHLKVDTIVIVDTTNSSSGWINTHSLLQDELTGIAFKTEVGLITGKKGVYYSTDSGIYSNSWNRANQYSSPADSILYNNSQFYGCYQSYSNPEIYFCGEDTVSHHAVIFTFNINSFKITSIYINSTTNRLNKIAAITNGYLQYYAVGSNGLIIGFKDTPTHEFKKINTPFSYDLISADVQSWTLICGAKDYKTEINFKDQNNPIFNETNYPDKIFRDVIFKPSSYNFIGVGRDYYRYDYYGNIEPHLYHADSLDGYALKNYAGNVYIGSSNGIYKTFKLTDVVEFQPTSINHHILSINNKGSRLFACGKNGAILYTNDEGGIPEPYGDFPTSGGCKGSTVRIDAIAGTVNTCKFYLNNSLAVQSCGNFTKTYSIPGAYNIKYVYSNSLYTDSIEHTIYIVDTPRVNLSYSISDIILCKEEPLEITINSPETDVYYTLVNYNSPSKNFGSSSPGSGAPVSFTSSVIDQSGGFHLKASHNLAACSALFKDTISVIVEKTKARFHSGLINAEQGEPVSFFENSKEASNFKWTFQNQTDTTTSNLPNPTHSFNDLGKGTIKLLAWSDNGCYDSIVKGTPFVYQKPTTSDSCWTMPLQDYDNISNDVIQSLTVSKTGYLLAGIKQKLGLQSRLGDSLFFENSGNFLAKYSNDGILKWCINSEYRFSNNTLFANGIIGHVVEDSKENIYVSGWTKGIVDNMGDTLNEKETNFLIKLDKNGALLWSRSFSQNIHDIEIDKFDNPYIVVYVGNSDNSYDPRVYLYLNKIISDTIISDNRVSRLDYTHNYAVVKLDSLGNMKYNFIVELHWTNPLVTPHCNFDNENNLILMGSQEILGHLHEVTSNKTFDLPTGRGGYGGKMFIAKYDTTGKFLWVMNGYSKDIPNDRTEVHDAVIDQNGNIYVTGLSKSRAGNPFIIESTDSSETKFEGGPYFVAKIRPSGICEWIQGNNATYYGMGHNIIIDNNKLIVVGNVSGNNTPYSCYFSSQNKTKINLSSNRRTNFIAQYNFEGDLMALDTLSWFTSDPDIYGRDKFIKSNDGLFLSVRNVSSNYYADALDQCGNAVPVFRYDAMVTKFNIDFNKAIQPKYYSSAFDSICSGSDYSFSDGTTFSNIDSALNYEIESVAVNGLDSIVQWKIDIYPTTGISGTSTICKGDSTMLTASGATTYSWSSGGSAATETVMPTSNKTYTVTGTDGNGCSTTATKTVTVMELPIISISGSSTVCSGNSTTLTASGALTYSWSSGGLSATETIMPTSNKTYTVTGTDGNGCSKTAAKIVTVKALPTLNITGISTICSGKSTTLTASGAATYLWNTGGSATTESVTPNINTTYTVTGIGLNTCSNTATKMVTVNPLPNITTTLNGNTISANQAGATYKWLNCNNGYSNVSGAINQNYTATTNGDYSVKITLGGCTDTSSCININTVGIENIVKNNNQLTIYPNPNNGSFIIESASEGVYLIINELGQTIQLVQLSSSNKYSMNIDNLNSGIYFIVGFNNEKQTKQKIVVTK